MSYNKKFDRNNEILFDDFDREDIDLIIYSYGTYERLTIHNTFGVEKAFCDDEFEK